MMPMVPKHVCRVCVLRLAESVQLQLLRCV